MPLLSRFRRRRFGGRFRGGGGGGRGGRRRQDTNDSVEPQENGDMSEGGAGDEDKPRPRYSHLYTCIFPFDI